MEAQSQAEDMQVIAHRHVSGEIFEANNLKTAHRMCPVLGRMSLEEAGLLLELEAMGKEQITDWQNTLPEQEKTVIKGVESIQPGRGEIKVGTKIAAEETARTNDMNQVPIESIATHGPDLEAVEVPRLRDDISITENPAPVISEQIVQQQSETPQERPTKVTIATKQETVNTEPLIESTKQSQVAEVEGVIEPAAFGISEEAPWTDMTESATTKTVDSDKHARKYDPPEADETILATDTFEQSSLKHSDDEEALPETVITSKHEQDGLTDFIQGESRPIIAIPELPAPVVQIEAVMAQLVEAMEGNEADEPAKINMIVEEIIMLPAKFEASTDEEPAVLEEKLEVLFVKLFEEVGVNYTPELITSFVKLTKTHYLERLFEIAKDSREEAQGLPDEIGTREFLQELQQALSTMKQAAINFYEIGRSILRLYSVGPWAR